ncbi:MAG: hypothetical protein FWB74_09025 [Defluviitaleaceae bacterium]|nr:hypothetical protein [Defluviitaleaceae bacterium]
MEITREAVIDDTLAKIFDLPEDMHGRKMKIAISNPEELGYKLTLGFMPGADIPDSFFEPLPEEDLQAWGL